MQNDTQQLKATWTYERTKKELRTNDVQPERYAPNCVLHVNHFDDRSDTV